MNKIKILGFGLLLLFVFTSFEQKGEKSSSATSHILIGAIRWDTWARRAFPFCYHCAIGVGQMADKIQKPGQILGIKVVKVCQKGDGQSQCSVSVSVCLGVERRTHLKYEFPEKKFIPALPGRRALQFAKMNGF